MYLKMWLDIAEDTNVLTTNSKMEKRRLICSTYNINTCFKLLKRELINLGFACATTLSMMGMMRLVSCSSVLQSSCHKNAWIK